VELRLPAKALVVLWHLVQHDREVVTRQAVMDAVWPEGFVGDDALTFQIRTLRKALQDDVRDPRYIQTIHRVGYRLLVPVAPEGNATSRIPLPRHEVPSTKARLVVGREAEHRQLEESLAAALRGIRRTVFLSGEAGIGKTVLVDSFLHSVAAGGQARILTGQCVEHYGTSEPYLPLLEAPAGDLMGTLSSVCCAGWLRAGWRNCPSW
jgi:DNA-binding winged helix-turn-helix (wHTH) protein